MNNEIILENPGLINAITFYKNKNFDEKNFHLYLEDILKIKYENKSFNVNDDFILKYNIINEIDYTTIEIWLLSKDQKEYKNTGIIKLFEELNINLSDLKLEIFTNKIYIICNNYIYVNFADKLLYNIYYKKIDEIRYIYSDLKDNEFIMNFLKHIIKFDIYYSKILTFYKKFSLSYPEIQKSNFVLINDYSKIIEGDVNKLNQKDLIELNKKINSLQAVNFGLMYDIESLTSNLENLESRIKTIGAEESRYFLNHIEKVKFIIESFDSILKKNNLIKENVLENYINFIKNNIETQKLENDKKKTHHIKNIKEILSGLAFVEIFINGLSETSKIFNFEENISKILENTPFMRMVLIIIFIICYLIFYFCKFLYKKIKYIIRNFSK